MRIPGTESPSFRATTLQWRHETNLRFFAAPVWGAAPNTAPSLRSLEPIWHGATSDWSTAAAMWALMGVLADAVLRAGGEAVGVIQETLMAREIGHNGLTKLHVVQSMHERKALMADLSDAFVALPGGFGTLEEFCEVVTWTQLGLHAKPCRILNVLRYYSPPLAMFDHAVEERFLKPENGALVLSRESPAELLQALEEWRPVRVEKWLDRETR